MSRLPVKEEGESSQTYALRITIPASEDIDAAHNHFVGTAGFVIADDWQEGFFEEIRLLTIMPRKYPTAPENSFFAEEIRQLIYRRRPYSPAYRILFTTVDRGEEGPFVRIIHVRHGARRSMTRKEARAIQNRLSE